MSDAPLAATPSPPQELCGYVVDCALTAGSSYLAIGPGGRGIVLKRMDSDCLLRGLLHPSIKERLARVRELAHAGVANLHGVGRDADGAWMIWEYVPGQTLDEYALLDTCTPRHILKIARELIRAVDSLHMQGIVHGAISGPNVIVTPEGSVRLTHISPLLYDDPSVDTQTAISVLEQIVEKRHEQGTELGQLLADARREQMGLRALGAKVTALLDTREQPTVMPSHSEETSVRRRTIVGAVVVVLIGMVIALGVWRALAGADWHQALRWIPQSLRAK